MVIACYRPKLVVCIKRNENDPRNNVQGTFFNLQDAAPLALAATHIQSLAQTLEFPEPCVAFANAAPPADPTSLVPS